MTLDGLFVDNFASKFICSEKLRKNISGNIMCL